jgi:hypothetical protein
MPLDAIVRRLLHRFVPVGVLLEKQPVGNRHQWEIDAIPRAVADLKIPADNIHRSKLHKSLVRFVSVVFCGWQWVQPFGDNAKREMKQYIGSSHRPNVASIVRWRLVHCWTNAYRLVSDQAMASNFVHPDPLEPNDESHTRHRPRYMTNVHRHHVFVVVVVVEDRCDNSGFGGC